MWCLLSVSSLFGQVSIQTSDGVSEAFKCHFGKFWFKTSLCTSLPLVQDKAIGHQIRKVCMLLFNDRLSHRTTHWSDLCRTTQFITTAMFMNYRVNISYWNNCDVNNTSRMILINIDTRITGNLQNKSNISSF